MSNNKFKVLIIEDEANICSFIQTLLETNGYQALVAQTCVMGMTMFISYNPDLVILDLGLPDRDGLDAIRQAVFLILSTPRYEYAIYNFQYGCETESLLGLSAELAQSEIKRSVKEAVLTDDRIKSVQNFVFKQENSNLSDWSLFFDVVTKDELVVGIKYNI